MMKCGELKNPPTPERNSEFENYPREHSCSGVSHCSRAWQVLRGKSGVESKFAPKGTSQMLIRVRPMQREKFLSKGRTMFRIFTAEVCGMLQLWGLMEDPQP